LRKEDEMPNPLALSFSFRFHKHGHDYIPKKKQIEFWNLVTKQLPPLQIKQIWKCLIHQSSTTILYPEWVSTFHGRSLERNEFGSDIHQIPVETKKKYFGARGTQSKWHNDCEHYCQIQ
jgi:hypothetical protein